MPVLAGVIDTSTARVGAHMSAALKAGVDGVVATAPFYAATHPAEIERHFTRLASLAGDTPLYAYDIPSRVGNEAAGAVDDLARAAGGDRRGEGFQWSGDESAAIGAVATGGRAGSGSRS